MYECHIMRTSRGGASSRTQVSTSKWAVTVAAQRWNLWGMQKSTPPYDEYMRQAAYLSTANVTNHTHRRGTSGVLRRPLAESGSSLEAHVSIRSLRAANAPSSARWAFTCSMLMRGLVSL